MTTTNAAPMRVLLADDSAESRELLCAMLGSIAQIDVVGVAADGRQTIDLLRTARADVVFLDIAMPVMDGLEAAALIRARHPDLRIIVYSAYDRVSMGLTALSAGADEYFQKAATLGQLVDQLRQAFPDREIHVKASTAVRTEPLPQQRELRKDNATTSDRRALLDALEQGVLVTDKDAMVVDANTAATLILQLPIGRVVGHNLTEIGLDDTESIGDGMRVGRPPRHLDLRLQRADGGTHPVRLTVRRLRTTAGEYVISLIERTDDPDQRRAGPPLDSTQDGPDPIDNNINNATHVNGKGR